MDGHSVSMEAMKDVLAVRDSDQIMGFLVVPHPSLNAAISPSGLFGNKVKLVVERFGE